MTERYCGHCGAALDDAALAQGACPACHMLISHEGDAIVPHAIPDQPLADSSEITLANDATGAAPAVKNDARWPSPPARTPPGARRCMLHCNLAWRLHYERPCERKSNTMLRSIPCRHRMAGHSTTTVLPLRGHLIQEDVTMLVSIVLWLVIGGVAGWLAGLVVQGTGLGLVGDIIVGIIGAFLGGIIMSLFGAGGASGFSLWSLFVAFVGAVILLFIIRLFTRGRATTV
jgi:uncharacterized membrane protein YeaQ/YmgE (transglycosylase-associated protein family)